MLDFKSKKIRVNLNLPIKAEVKAESADVLKAVDEDRKYVIQATIVRYVIFLVSPFSLGLVYILLFTTLESWKLERRWKTRLWSRKLSHRSLNASHQTFLISRRYADIPLFSWFELIFWIFRELKPSLRKNTWSVSTVRKIHLPISLEVPSAMEASTYHTFPGTLIFFCLHNLSQPHIINTSCNLD